MSTIVEDLRGRARGYRIGGPSASPTAVMLDEAADRIEQLEAALERIDKMEAYFYEDGRDVLCGKIGIMRDIARAALEKKA